MNELFLRFLLCAVPVLFFSTLRFCASDRARRMYIRVWLWWSGFCKHGSYIRGFYPKCDDCTKEKRDKERASNRRYLDWKYESMAKAERLVKEL